MQKKNKTYPLTVQQLQLYYEWQMRPESSEFNVGLALQLNGVDIKKLKGGLQFLHDHIDSYRARLVQTDDGVIQQEIGSYKKQVSIKEMSFLEYGADAELKALSAGHEMLSKPFCLQENRLSQTALFQYGIKDYLLVFSGHHLLWDYSVAGIFMGGLSLAYHNPLLTKGCSILMKNLHISLPSVNTFIKKYQFKEEKFGEAAARHWNERLNGGSYAFDLGIKPPNSNQQQFITGENEDQRIISKEIHWDPSLLPIEGTVLKELGNFPDPKPGGRISFKLSSGLTKKIREFSGNKSGGRESTLFITLSTMLQTLLYRYSGQEDLIISYAANVRPQGPSIFKNYYNYFLVGYFVNKLPLRTKIKSSDTYRALVKRVFAKTKNDRKFKWFPYGKILQILKSQPNFVENKNPITISETRFAIDNILFKGVDVVGVTNFRGAVQSGLALLYDNSGEHIQLGLEYNRKTYADDTALDIAKRLVMLMESAINNPESPLADLNIFLPEEKVSLHDTLTQKISKDKENIISFFEESVSKNGKATALVLDDRSISYAELNRKSNQLARYLMENKLVHSEQLVAIAMERSVEMVVAIIAILKAGGGYVPLDPNQPEDRLKFIAEDIYNSKNPNLVITQQHLKSQFQYFDNIVDLNGIDEFLSQYSPENLGMPISENNLAYAIYTSGSTGKPKGVLLEHHGVISRYKWMLEEFNLTSKDSFIQRTPFTFDPSVREFFWPLFLGGKLILVNEKSSKDPRYLGRLTRKYEVSVVSFVPDLLDAFLESEDASTCPSIRIITSGADALDNSLVKRCYNKFPNATLYNLYGPTEATIFSTFWKCPKDSLDSYVPIGNPVGNVQVLILDKNNRILPEGITGELCLAGDGLARGYLNRDALTEEKFLEYDLLDSGKRIRIYKTGDLVRDNGNGIEFLGRVDRQVKIRGYRVELGEIEGILLQHSKVRSAVVTTVTSAGNNKSLLAYFTTGASSQSAECTIIDEPEAYQIATDLRENLTELLPDYMVPEQIVQIGSMPLNTNGKVDLKRLPMIKQTRTRTTTIESPRNEYDEKVREIWSKLLEIEEESIGIQDNFFELGGHSLLLIQLQSKLCAFFDIEIPLQTLFQLPTIQKCVDHFVPSQKEENNKESATSDQNLQDTLIKLLESDVEWLPETVGQEVQQYTTDIKHILLTGSNGFLGVHLLAEILENSKATVHCIIRGENNLKALKKLEDSLLKFGFDKWVGNDRIIVHCGDLSKSKLGLSKAAVTYLEKEIDAIYHNGAQVHHLYGYEMLRQANVVSTQWLLEFALSEKKKKFFYISSRGVVVDKSKAVDSILLGPSKEIPDTENGYVLSKWVGESIVWNTLIERGLEGKILRPGLLAGHSKTGRLNSDSYHMALFLKGICQMRHIPKELAVEMTPVDIVARAVYRLSLSDENPAELFNLHNPSVCRQSDIIALLEDMSYNINPVPLAEFRELVADLPEDNAYYVYKDRFLNATEGWERIGEDLPPDTTTFIESQGAINEVGVQYPDDLSICLRKMFDFWHQTEFIQLDNHRE